MKSELNHEKNILKNKNNDWAIFNLFISYLRSNRSIIFFSVLISPLIFIIASIWGNSLVLATPNGKNIGRIILMIIWLIQTTSLTIQNFLAILLDLKQSVIYRRIGLTRITKSKFILMSSLFNLILIFISDIIIFIGVIIAGYALGLSPLITSIFNWQILIIILFTLFLSITIISVALLMSVIIKSRTGQAIAGIFTSLLIIAPLIILTYFLNTIVTSNLVANLGIGGVIAILTGIFIFINIVSSILYVLTWKLFKWFD